MLETSLQPEAADSTTHEPISGAWVERWLSDYSHRTGKLWPLQAVNACNPLAAYEHLPFTTALTQAAQELDFSIERGLDVFKRLYQDQTFTDQDLEAALTTNEQSWLNRTLPFRSITLTYREVLASELGLMLTSGNLDSASAKHDAKYGAEHWRAEIQQSLESAVLDCFAEQAHPHKAQLNPSMSIHPHHMTWINEQATKWLAAYMDEGHATWMMPGQGQPFRKAWGELVLMDGQIPPAMKAALKTLISRCNQADLPAIEAIAQLGLENSLSTEQQKEWMDSHLRQLPGWAAYIHYCQSSGSHPSTLLADYLLMRLIYHVAGATLDWGETEAPSSPVLPQEVLACAQRLQGLANSALFSAQTPEVFAEALLEHISEWKAYCETMSPARQLALLMAALEHSQQSPLIEELAQAFTQGTPSAHQEVPTAQAVFCIDVRSEPYRKHLEEIGAIETYGFAGFFGLPIAKVSYADEEAVSVCPILLEPKYSVTEAPASQMREGMLGGLLRQGLPFRHQWTYALKKIKREPFATFSYVEGLGVVHAFTLLKDSFASLPLGRIHQAVRSKLMPLLGLKPKLDGGSGEQDSASTGISLPEQVTLADNILKMMGLGEPYAEFVVICGHAGQAYNNLYASSLNCGACGANAGGFNALVLCQILNRQEVREALAANGRTLPAETRFIAAEHNTTTDIVSFLNPEVLDSQQQMRFAQVQATFEEATVRNRQVRQERLKQHSSVSASADLVGAGYDWSQTRPEWGLSKNQAFIIGDRQATQSLDLQGRCFLHSYDWQRDADGAVLTMILTGPMVVGAWINLQYGFSTLDAQRFGSGPKYLHNSVGLFGTYVGNASDLQVGLPYESLFANDGSPYHYPQRLLVVVTAPLDRVQAIIESQPHVRHLVRNEWIHLMVFDPVENTSHRISASSHWL